jgi:hypothetical protein
MKSISLNSGLVMKWNQPQSIILSKLLILSVDSYASMADLLGAGKQVRVTFSVAGPGAIGLRASAPPRLVDRGRAWMVTPKAAE